MGYRISCASSKSMCPCCFVGKPRDQRPELPAVQPAADRQPQPLQPGLLQQNEAPEAETRMAISGGNPWKSRWFHSWIRGEERAPDFLKGIPRIRVD